MALKISPKVTTILCVSLIKCLQHKKITEVIIEEGITAIGSYAFRGCTNLKSIIMPESVVAIQGYAFSGCKSLELIELHEGITTIWNNAFYGCSNLKYVFIPSTITEIGHEILSDSPAFICSDKADCYESG